MNNGQTVFFCVRVIALMWVAGSLARGQGLSPLGPAQEYIRLNGRIIAVENTVPATISANPNPIMVPAGATTGVTTISWNAPGYSSVVVHLGSATGQTFSGGGPTGSATTGNWTTDGLVFVLTDSNNNAIASTTAHLQQASVAGPGVYDDKDPRLIYSGSWTPGTSASLFNNTESYTNVVGNSVSFGFTGTQVSYVYAMTLNIGYAKVSIDGNVVTSQLDGYLAPTGSTTNFVWQKLATYSGLSNGTHTITVSAVGTANPNAIDHYITVDAFIVGATHNDTDTAMAYTPSSAWTYASNQVGTQLWQLDEHYINAAGLATFSFTGTFVTYVYSPYPNMGLVTITIDGINRGTLDAYCPSKVYQAGKIFSGLSSGSHTMAVSWTGSKNAASSAAYVTTDAFITAQ